MGKRKIPSRRLDRTRCRVCGGYVSQEQWHWRANGMCEKHRLIAVKAYVTGQHAAQYQREFPRLKAEQRKAGERRAPEPKAQTISGFRVKKHAKPKIVKRANGRRSSTDNGDCPKKERCRE